MEAVGEEQEAQAGGWESRTCGHVFAQVAASSDDQYMSLTLRVQGWKHTLESCRYTDVV